MNLDYTSLVTDRMAAEKEYRGKRVILLFYAAASALNLSLLLAMPNDTPPFTGGLTVALGRLALRSGTFGRIAILILAALVMTFYVICWWRSGKNYKWLFPVFPALALESVFSVALGVILRQAATFAGIILYIVVAFETFRALKCGEWLKNTPLPEELIKQGQKEENGQNEQKEENEKNEAWYPDDTRALRRADMTVRYRTLLSATVMGHTVLYRRVKRTNELVIDGYVYDEYIALCEFPHCLNAVKDGHLIQAGIDITCHSYIALDGQIVCEKLRLV